MVSKLIAQRVALGILLLVAVSVLIFAGTNLLPGDVAQAVLGKSATPLALQNLRKEMGLNDPAYVRYFHWLVGILHGDLGTALTTKLNIAASIKERLWNTLFLAFWAAIVSIPLAVILGFIAVRHHNRPVDKLISGLARLERYKRRRRSDRLPGRPARHAQRHGRPDTGPCPDRRRSPR